MSSEKPDKEVLPGSTQEAYLVSEIHDFANSLAREVEAPYDYRPGYWTLRGEKYGFSVDREAPRDEADSPVLIDAVQVSEGRRQVWQIRITPYSPYYDGPKLDATYSELAVRDGYFDRDAGIVIPSRQTVLEERVMTPDEVSTILSELKKATPYSLFDLVDGIVEKITGTDEAS